MSVIDPAALAGRDRYRLMVNAVVPRPIAWCTTSDAAGAVNLAPFSYFNAVCAAPPMLAVSIASRIPIKDTLANLQTNGEVVVHLVPGDHLADAHDSGGEYAHHVSEPALLDLELVPSLRVRPPRLAIAEIAFECRLHQEIPLGSTADGRPSTHLCLLDVVLVHVADAIAGTDGLPDPNRLRACARLGGDAYLTTDDWSLRHLPRTPVPDGMGIRRP